MFTKVTDQSAWKGEELHGKTDWLVAFTADELAEIDAAISSVRSKGLSLAEIGTQTFPLPTVKHKLASYVREIRNGRGFVVLRGIPVAKYTDDEVGMIFWGLGTYLGAPVCQTPKGELLGHVKDYGRKLGGLDVRGFETNAHLNFHTDSADIIGLMCLRKAKSGGLSSVVSSMAIYNDIIEKHPEFMPVYERGFQYIRREAAFTDKPVSPHRLPIFGEKDGVVSCRYLRTQIEAGAVALGKPLEPNEVAALDYFDSLSRDPKFHLDMDLEVGDIQLINNYTTLHSRTGFEDFPEPERRRHMLRLWLVLRERRPLPPSFPPYLGYGLGQTHETALADEQAMSMESLST
ncbi:TauD/TfdA family dioxygenase [soil metagenome]